MRTDPSAQPAPEQPIAAATSFYPSTNMTPWSRVSTDLISSLLVGAVEAQHAADGRRVLGLGDSGECDPLFGGLMGTHRNTLASVRRLRVVVDDL